MAYIGWATNVNKTILDSTTVTVGDGAAVRDSLETGGQKKSRLTRANPSDRYSVTMAFSFADDEKDSDGRTELDRFWIWYKWQHCYGVNPFKFPAILLNSNRQKGWAVEERAHIANRQSNSGNIKITADEVPDYEYYCITSAVEGSKNGTDCQVTMTWETYAAGAITVPDDAAVIDHIEPSDGCIDVVLTATPQTEPTDDTYAVYIDGTKTKTTGFVFDGDVTLCLFFKALEDKKEHKAKVSTFEKTFVAE